MEFVQGKEGYCEEDEEMIGDMGKFLFASSSSFSPSSYQYKGVLPQPNGRWGAQIDENQQRSSLGSFESSEGAALQFHGHEVVTNFNQKVELMNFLPRNNDNNGRGDSDGGGSSGGRSSMWIEREHMFDKVVTPSDVGKLNRLVIPKQHAEKYFPLDSSTNEKGLLLNFEDRSGKPWRFRYSYWNSSQSYVMTKGWSRFVKEKKLDAGDTVSFERGIGELGKDRLYIDWRRRPDAPDNASLSSLPLLHPLSLPQSVPWDRLFLRPSNTSVNYDLHHHHRNQTSYSGSTYGYNGVNSGSGFYLRSSAPQQVGVVQQGGDVPMVFDSVPVVHGKAAAKRVRLFGVNLECPISEDHECDVLSSTTMQHTTMASLSLPPQFRLYNGAPLPTMPTESPNKEKQSLSFNLNI